MNSKYEVRQSTIEDLNELSEIFNDYRVFYQQESNVEKTRQFLFERFEHQESIVFVVKDTVKGKIIGFTQLYPLFSSISMERSLLLNDLYVSQEYRKQGIGQLLLDKAKRYATHINAKGLALSTAVDNLQAQRLYERNGYLKDQEYYHYFLKLKKYEEM